MDKTEKNIGEWVSASGVEFINVEAEMVYKRRAKRIADAIQFKKPDCVPVVPSFNMFPAFYSGFTCEEVMYDYKKSNEAWLKAAIDFNPDAMAPPVVGLPGAALGLLGYNPLKLPGKHIRSDLIYQFDEREFVEAEEFYDWYLNDPSDFMLRRFLPAVCDVLEPFKELPLMTSMLSYCNGLLDGALLFAADGVVEAFGRLVEAGKEVKKYFGQLSKAANHLKSIGFPNLMGGICNAPFDAIGDWFRGTYGIMTDMYRYPDQLKAVMKQRVPIEVDFGVAQTIRSGSPTVGIMLHKGSKSLMTSKQFEEFYWPSLRDVMMRIIDAGYIPMPFFEGDYNSRLEIIKDIPRGKAVYCFEEVNIYEAKKVLGNHVCFRGNVPDSLMQLGTPNQVKEYVKELIDVFGKDGGLIVDCNMWLDKAKPENMQAMIHATLEYGCS